MDEDNDDAIPFCIATGDVQKLVTFFTRRGQLLEALLIAQVWGRGHRAPMTSDEDFDQYPLRSGSQRGKHPGAANVRRQQHQQRRGQETTVPQVRRSNRSIKKV